MKEKQKCEQKAKKNSNSKNIMQKLYYMQKMYAKKKNVYAKKLHAKKCICKKRSKIIFQKSMQNDDFSTNSHSESA